MADVALPSVRGVLRAAGGIALTVSAVVGACCVLAALAGIVVGVHPLIFRSGSMSPTIPAGSLAIAHQTPAGDLRVGDVVSVPYAQTRVTHRIVTVTHGSGTATLQLQGDANDRPDDRLYQVASADRVWFSVPILGRAIAWLSHPPGVFVLAAYAGVMIAVLIRRPSRSAPGDDEPPDDELPDDEPPDDEPPDEDQPDEDQHHAPRAGSPGSDRRSRVARGAVLVVAALTGTAGLGATPSWAVYTDSAAVSGSTVKTYTVPAPTLSCGLLGLLSVTMNWTAVPGATSYTLHYGANGSMTLSTTATSFTFVTVITGGTAWVTANRGFGSTTWTSAKSNTRTYTVAVVSLCA